MLVKEAIKQTGNLPKLDDLAEKTNYILEHSIAVTCPQFIDLLPKNCTTVNVSSI
jgi:hypothetical protein